MLDCGTGASRLKYYKDVLDRYDEVSIILSHYHLDHMVGFIYLVPYLKDKKLTIYGPGKLVYAKSTKEYFDDFLQPAFFSHSIDNLTKEVHCIDYNGEDFMIGDVHIGIVPQAHSSPSFQIKIDEELIYATDTHFDLKHWDQKAKAKILLHECWTVKGNDYRHSTLEKLIQGIPQENFNQILIIHHNPEWTKEDIAEINKMIEGTKFLLAQDNLCIKA